MKNKKSKQKFVSFEELAKHLSDPKTEPKFVKIDTTKGSLINHNYGK